LNLDEDHALTEKVSGLAMKVHRSLGPGFLESVYLNALLSELRHAGMKTDVGQRIKVHHGNVIVGDFIADLLVEDALVCELKAISSLTKSGKVQLVNYLSATRRDFGLLLNFGALSLQFGRKYRRPAFAPETADLHGRSRNPVHPVNPV
jgi:GxxExxY protein